MSDCLAPPAWWLPAPGHFQALASSRLPAPCDHLQLETRPPCQEHKGDEAGEARETNQTARQCPSFPASTISGQCDHPTPRRLLRYRHNRCGRSPGAATPALSLLKAPLLPGHHLTFQMLKPVPQHSRDTTAKVCPRAELYFLEMAVGCSLQLQLSLSHGYHPQFFCWTAFLPRRAGKKTGTAGQLQKMSGHSSCPKTSISCHLKAGQRVPGLSPRLDYPGQAHPSGKRLLTPDWDC